MDVLDLLAEARARGLRVRAEGDQLVVVGPRREEPFVRQLLERKPELMAVLRRGSEPPDLVPPPIPSVLQEWAEDLTDWIDEISTCRARLETVGTLIHDFARSRWGNAADSWSPRFLAGFYANDLLAGLVASLGPWPGWGPIRAELASPTGPIIFATLWDAYAALDGAMQERVKAAGDRTQSPPACLRFPWPGVGAEDPGGRRA